MKSPSSFLDIRVDRVDLVPALKALCAGYEGGEWRADQLAAHLFEWLPEFALTHREVKAVGAHNAVAIVRRAANSVYKTKKFSKRGEFGELLLHVAIRQIYKTIPAVSKIFYKDGPNEVVKGFDAVHVVSTQSGLELWLGEAKFYKSLGRAVSDVVTELVAHSQRDYLKGEFVSITNKIDDSWPHSDKLRKLLHPNRSLDEVFDSVVIPVLLTYDSKVVASHKALSKAFLDSLMLELISGHAKFASTWKAAQKTRDLSIRLLLFPMADKKRLAGALDRELRRFQA